MRGVVARQRRCEAPPPSTTPDCCQPTRSGAVQELIRFWLVFVLARLCFLWLWSRSGVQRAWGGGKEGGGGKEEDQEEDQEERLAGRVKEK